MKILVTGATGQLGGAVVRHLLKNTAASHISILVRDENKAHEFKEMGVNIHPGDYYNLDSLASAMQGVDKVLLIPGTDEEKRLQQHKNVIDTAIRAGVPFIAYASRCLRDPATLVNQLMQGHFQTEDYIRESGLNYAIFQNILYMDTIPNFVGDEVFGTGINLPVGDGQVSFALRQEMGEAMANALLEQTAGNEIYRLTGSKLYSFGDIADTLTELSGKNVRYKAIDKAAFELKLKEKGLPGLIIDRITGFLSDIANGQENTVTDDLEMLLGRKPASLKEGLKVLYGL
jgi:NAD(P)H dehydrogenase (quinone)